MKKEFLRSSARISLAALLTATGITYFEQKMSPSSPPAKQNLQLSGPRLGNASRTSVKSEIRDLLGERREQAQELARVLTGQKDTILTRYELDEWLQKRKINPLIDIEVIYAGNSTFHGQVAAQEGVETRHFPDVEYGVSLQKPSEFNQDLGFSHLVRIGNDIWGASRIPLKEDPKTSRWEFTAVKYNGETLITISTVPFENLFAKTVQQ